MLKPYNHPLLYREPWVGLIDGRRYDEHVIHSYSDQQKREQVVNSGSPSTQQETEAV